MITKSEFRIKILVTFFVLIFSTYMTILGQMGSDRELTDMNLDELLNVEIMTVSKKWENITDSPGVVTTVTAREIEYFGANNLLEVLERVPGIYGMWSHYFPQNGFSMRGDYPSHVNPHILLLIDGRPSRESVQGGFNSGIYTTFPLSAIERIEIVRGPGSVLYGTNAFSGVVNIITKKSKSDQMKLNIGGGSFGTIKGSLGVGLKRKTFDINAHANYFKETGWGFSALMAPGAPVTADYSEELYSANVNFNFGNISLNAFWGSNNQGIAVPFPIAKPGTYKSKRLFLDIGYEYEFSSIWTTKLNVTYNYMKDDFDNLSGFVAEPKSEDIVLEMTHFIKPDERMNILFGGSVNLQAGHFKIHTTSTPTYPVELYHQTWWNLYLQADYRPSKYFKLIAGGQLNKPNTVDIDFVPRIGVVLNATDKLGFKFLYGQAFRSAFSLETKIVNPPVLLGDANLEPEKIRTIDAQVFFSGKKTQFAATYFLSKEKNLITRKPSPVPGFQLIYTNAGTLTLQGIELEVKSNPNKNIFLMGSLAYMHNHDDDNLEDITFMPNFLAKAGIAYSRKNLYSISVFNTFSSKTHEVSMANPNAANVNPKVNSFNNLTANVRFNLAKLFNISRTKSIMFSIYAVNLLDAKLYQPEVIFQRINTVPARGGRAFYATLSFDL